MTGVQTCALPIFEGLQSKNKAGKSVLAVAQGAKALNGALAADPQTDEIAAVTSQGHLLVFPARELPVMPRGKGLKLIQIPGAKHKSGEEVLVGVVVIPAGAGIRIAAGSRHLTLKSRDLDAYRGERAKRGNKLPRGLQRVDAIETAV